MKLEVVLSRPYYSPLKKLNADLESWKAEPSLLISPEESDFCDDELFLEKAYAASPFRAI